MRAPNRRRTRRFNPLNGSQPLSKTKRLVKYQSVRTTSPRPGSYSGLANRERSTQAPSGGAGWAVPAAGAAAKLSGGNGLTSRTKRGFLEGRDAARDGL